MSEFAPELWRTSSRTGPNGQCVEVAMTPTEVGVRDTKNRTGAQLTVSAPAFAALIRGIKDTDGWRE